MNRYKKQINENQLLLQQLKKKVKAKYLQIQYDT